MPVVRLAPRSGTCRIDVESRQGKPEPLARVRRSIEPLAAHHWVMSVSVGRQLRACAAAASTFSLVSCVPSGALAPARPWRSGKRRREISPGDLGPVGTKQTGALKT